MGQRDLSFAPWLYSKLPTMCCSIVSLCITALMIAVVMAGCTSVPQEDFSAYRQAFTEAREASKPLINDLGLAWRDSAEIASGDEDGRASDWEAFDPAELARPLTIDDKVLVRHQLWLIIERYNIALAALAEGRSPEEVEGLVGGFLMSVRDLPIRRLADLAESLHPFGGLISETLFIMEREATARQFHRAIEEGGPLVIAILRAMQEEIGNHYNLRLTLNRRARRAIDAEFQMSLAPAFLDIYESTGEHEEKSAIQDQLNEALRERFRYQDHQILSASSSDEASPPSAAELAQLSLIASQVAAMGADLESLRGELVSYQKVLRAYYELLHIVQYRMKSLLHASKARAAVGADDVLLAAANLQWLFTQYQDARANR